LPAEFGVASQPMPLLFLPAYRMTTRLTSQKLRRYDGEDITISYDVKRCVHAEECVRGLPRVFDPGRRVWVDATQASAGEIANTVQRCPTGALHFRRTDGGVEEPIPRRNEVRLTPDGPLYFRGELEIHTPTGMLKETRAALCCCGASRNKPFCDRSHVKAGFRDIGATLSPRPQGVVITQVAELRIASGRPKSG
jgi:uncharacterized Fe-S cluster protein YjdI/CDGSH-type Zn-finger protein